MEWSKKPSHAIDLLKGQSDDSRSKKIKYGKNIDFSDAISASV
jgi:hypothetical protein